MERRDGFASTLRGLRLRAGLSQSALARRASYSKPYISNLERGVRQPSADTADALDRALNAGGALARLVPGPAPAGRAAASVPGLEPSFPCSEASFPSGRSACTLEEILQWWDEAMRRRSILIGGGAAAAAAAMPQGSVPGGRERFEVHGALRAAYGRMDNLYGAASVYSRAVEHHRQVVAWYQQASGAEHREVAALAATTGGFVGWLTADLGHFGEAATWYRQAVDFASAAGDVGLCANNIGQMSRNLAVCGRRREARAFCDTALRVAGSQAHPAVRSWLHAVSAYHHAGTGDERAVRTDLDEAWRILGTVDSQDVPTYIGYVGAAELYKWQGHALTRLDGGGPQVRREGLAAFETAYARWSPTMVRGSAEVISGHSRAYLALGEVGEAARWARKGFDVASATGSNRNLRMAGELHTRLLPYAGTAEMRDWDAGPHTPVRLQAAPVIGAGSGDRLAGPGQQAR